MGELELPHPCGSVLAESPCPCHHQIYLSIPSIIKILSWSCLPEANSTTSQHLCTGSSCVARVLAVVEGTSPPPSPLLLVGHGRVAPPPRVLGGEGPALVVGAVNGDGTPHGGLGPLLLGVLHGPWDVPIRGRLHPPSSGQPTVVTPTIYHVVTH